MFLAESFFNTECIQFIYKDRKTPLKAVYYLKKTQNKNYI